MRNHQFERLESLLTSSSTDSPDSTASLYKRKWLKSEQVLVELREDNAILRQRIEDDRTAYVPASLIAPLYDNPGLTTPLLVITLYVFSQVVEAVNLGRWVRHLCGFGYGIPVVASRVYRVDS